MSSPASDAPATIDTPQTSEPITATDATMRQVQRLAKLVTEALHNKNGQPLFSLLGPNHESVQLPTDVLTLLQQLLAILAAGDSVTVVPVHKELTTQQAANLLNVSRQYLVQLLDEGKLPYHRTGTHRRLYSKDVLAYRARRKAERRTLLDELIQETQEAGGYPELEPR